MRLVVWKCKNGSKLRCVSNTTPYRLKTVNLSFDQILVAKVGFLTFVQTLSCQWTFPVDISVTIRIIYTIIRLDLLLKSFFCWSPVKAPPHLIVKTTQGCCQMIGTWIIEAANLTNRTPKKCLPLPEVSLRKMAWKLRDHWFNDSGLISCNGVEMGKHYLSGLNFFFNWSHPKTGKHEMDW